jgi:hypothetical protein
MVGEKCISPSPVCGLIMELFSTVIFYHNEKEMLVG